MFWGSQIAMNIDIKNLCQQQIQKVVDESIIVACNCEIYNRAYDFLWFHTMYFWFHAIMSTFPVEMRQNFTGWSKKLAHFWYLSFLPY